LDGGNPHVSRKIMQGQQIIDTNNFLYKHDDMNLLAYVTV